MNIVVQKTNGMGKTSTGQLHLMPQESRSRRDSFTSEVYRLHSFRVVDADGKKVGIVDWIWKDASSGAGEFLGVHLHWLRGTVRPIPCLGAEINFETATIRVPHTAAQIKRSRRLKIDRTLTAREKRSICFHYAVQPAALPSLANLQSSAA